MIVNRGKIGRVVLRCFIISTILILNSNLYAFAFMTKTSMYSVISYGMAMFLMIWQWSQYIVPIITFFVLIILNKKNLNIKKIIIFLVVCVLLSVLLFTTGNIIANKAESQGYSSSSGSMFEFNGKIFYYHK